MAGFLIANNPRCCRGCAHAKFSSELRRRPYRLSGYQRGMSGVYRAVSAKHLHSYSDQYTFRYKNPDADGRGTFNAFLARIEEGSAGPFWAACLNPSKNALRLRTGISSPFFMVCLGSPSRVSCCFFRSIVIPF